jgi:hypothetical protein
MGTMAGHYTHRVPGATPYGTDSLVLGISDLLDEFDDGTPTTARAGSLKLKAWNRRPSPSLRGMSGRKV